MPCATKPATSKRLQRDKAEGFLGFYILIMLPCNVETSKYLRTRTFVDYSVFKSLIWGKLNEYVRKDMRLLLL